MRTQWIFCVVLLCCGTAALAGEQPSILPAGFGGWHLAGSVTRSSSPADADAANAALLKEYGFSQFESANYRREDGRKLALKTARFADVSGAFGAYTFYYKPEMVREEIGDQACSFNERILFYRGNILVDAVFDRVTAMSAAELRELAAALPRPTGSAANAPPVLAYMPRAGYQKNTEKYAGGPIGLAQAASPVPADVVDFGAGAEVALGRYKSGNSEALLMVINYPTPQIAADHLRKIQAALRPQTPPGAGTGREPVFENRSGPLLVIVSGTSEAEARSLLASVNYDADVTWNESTKLDQKNNLGLLLVNIIILCAILIGLALVAGLAFGGVRIALQRLLPGRIFERPETVEFIALHLEQKPEDGTGEKLISSIKAS